MSLMALPTPPDMQVRVTQLLEARSHERYLSQRSPSCSSHLFGCLASRSIVQLHPTTLGVNVPRQAQHGTDRREFASHRSLLRSQRPTRRTLWRQSRRCDQMNGSQSAFSGHTRDRQNPVDSTKHACNRAVSQFMMFGMTARTPNARFC